MNIANTGGSLVLLLIFIMAGFILPKTQIPNWWEWSYSVSPLSYGYRAFAINEFFAPRWMTRMSSDNVTPLGRAVLQSVDIPTETSWYWYGAASLLGFAVLFNVLFTFALMYFDAPGKPQAVISKEAAAEMENQQGTNQQARLQTNACKQGKTTEMQHIGSKSASNDGSVVKKGMVLPFTPLAMSLTT